MTPFYTKIAAVGTVVAILAMVTPLAKAQMAPDDAAVEVVVEQPALEVPTDSSEATTTPPMVEAEESTDNSSTTPEVVSEDPVAEEEIVPVVPKPTPIVQDMPSQGILPTNMIADKCIEGAWRALTDVDGIVYKSQGLCLKGERRAQ